VRGNGSHLCFTKQESKLKYVEKRALMNVSEMIRAQKGTHSRSETVAVQGSPCTPARNGNSASWNVEVGQVMEVPQACRSLAHIITCLGCSRWACPFLSWLMALPPSWPSQVGHSTSLCGRVFGLILRFLTREVPGSDLGPAIRSEVSGLLQRNQGQYFN
jgi:hypothetical protein